MNTSVIDKASSILAEAYAGPGAAIGGGLLDTLIQVLMDLLGGCFGSGSSPAQILDLGRSTDPRKERVAALLVEQGVRRSLRQRHGVLGYMRHGGEKIKQTYLTAIRNPSVTEQDLADFSQLPGVG